MLKAQSNDLTVNQLTTQSYDPPIFHLITFLQSLVNNGFDYNKLIIFKAHLISLSAKYVSKFLVPIQFVRGVMVNLLFGY